MSQTPSALLEAAFRQGAFTHAYAVALRRGALAFECGAGEGSASTVFDLASITKAMSTTAAFMALWSDGLVSPALPVQSLWPDTAAARARITLGDLLAHRSGLPPYVPYFAEVMRRRPRLFEKDCPAAERAAARDEVIAQAKTTEPFQRVGEAAVYSDVGFILLGELLAHASGLPLDALYETRVRAPMALGAHFRRLSSHPAAEPLAPTWHERPRPRAPEQTIGWAPLPAYPSALGEVDDDNAWTMDGVAGHAGLFGTAHDLARFGQRVLEELHGAGRLASAERWAEALTVDATTRDSTRTLGFDTPSSVGSSAGAWFGQRPPGAFGHLGFTGVSLWVDRAEELVVALCTNGCKTDRVRSGIRELRARFHDAAFRS